jgi:hypothetical protein
MDYMGDIAKFLTFSHYSHNKNGRTEVKRRYMDENFEGYDQLIIGKQTYIDENGICQQFTIDDIDLSVWVPRGSKVEKDTVCDSAFMLQLLEGVGTSIWAALHWVDKEEAIYLFIDNAGGGGGMGQIKQRVSMRINC